LNSLELLLDSVEEVNCDRHEAERFLTSTAGEDFIINIYNEVTNKYRIHAIPALVIDGGRYVLSGAVTWQELYSLLAPLVESHDFSGKRLFTDISSIPE
jgi:predicted DsbA family dithiol-disulfide isomerase